MQRALELLTNLQGRVGTGHPVPADGLKGTGIDDQLTSNPVADRLMSMAVDYAVCVREEGPKARFNIMAEAIAMCYSDGKVTELKGQLVG